MPYFPDLSGENTRRSQLSYLLLVGVICVVGWNENRMTDARQQSETARLNEGSQTGTVQRENNAVWGLAGAIGDAMNQGIHDSYSQQQKDEASFNRRFDNEQREKQYEKDNND